MKIEVKTCYSHLLWMQLQGKIFSTAIESFTCSRPLFEFEGVSGYIEVTINFNIRELSAFAELWSGWYTYTDRTNFYHKISSGRMCE